MWFRFHETLSREAFRRAKSTKVLLLGDSITESFRGTVMGQHLKKDRLQGVPEVWRSAFGDKGTHGGASWTQPCRHPKS